MKTSSETQSVTETASPKAALVVDAALRILREDGATGLTMRRVAREVGVSLSNVQYYFRDRDALLAAMVGHYTTHCEVALRGQTEATADLDLHERRRFLLASALSHGHEITEMCALFREIWAVSARNATVADALNAYYQSYATMLVDALLPKEATAEVRQRITLLIVPYVEGYSVVAPAFADRPDDALNLLTDLVRAVENSG